MDQKRIEPDLPMANRDVRAFAQRAVWEACVKRGQGSPATLLVDVARALARRANNKKDGQEYHYVWEYFMDGDARVLAWIEYWIDYHNARA